MKSGYGFKYMQADYGAWQNFPNVTGINGALHWFLKEKHQQFLNTGRRTKNSLFLKIEIPQWCMFLVLWAKWMVWGQSAPCTIPVHQVRALGLPTISAWPPHTGIRACTTLHTQSSDGSVGNPAGRMTLHQVSDLQAKGSSTPGLVSPVHDVATLVAHRRLQGAKILY